MYIINGYSFGKIQVNDEVFTRDIIVSNQNIYPNWWRKEGHNLYIVDIKEYIEKEKPEYVVIGTGYYGIMKVSEEVKQYFEKMNLKVFIGKTKDAVEKFNELVSKNVRVIGFFHLTC